MNVLAQALAGAMLVMAGCEEEGGPLMRPGEACLGCHDFTAAGTVFADATGSAAAAGATVTITDSASRVVALTANSAGNFYTSEPLAPPLDVAITRGSDTADMAGPASGGDCNSCHGGIIHVP